MGTLAKLYCPKCRASVEWPSGLDVNAKSELAAWRRSSPVDAQRHIHSNLGLGLGESKVLVHHISSDRGTCHRCGSAISGLEVICEKCRSLDLNW